MLFPIEHLNYFLHYCKMLIIEWYASVWRWKYTIKNIYKKQPIFFVTKLIFYLYFFAMSLSALNIRNYVAEEMNFSLLTNCGILFVSLNILLTATFPQPNYSHLQKMFDVLVTAAFCFFQLTDSSEGKKYVPTRFNIC